MKKETPEQKAKRLKETAEKKEAEAKKVEAETEDEAVGDPEQDGASHDDAAQDTALIKKLIGEYIGKDVSEAEMEAMEGIAKEALEAHKEMGASEQEAYERAGHALKLAKHMASKQAENKQAEAKEDECMDKKESDDKDADDKKEEKQKESNRVKELEKQLLETKGRLAALETQSKKGELEAHIEKTLRESGQPNSITKRFKEAAGELKSQKDFDSKWKIFLEGVKNTKTTLDWSPIAEKTLMQESDFSEKKKGKTLDFSNCAED